MAALCRAAARKPLAHHPITPAMLGCTNSAPDFACCPCCCCCSCSCSQHRADAAARRGEGAAARAYWCPSPQLQTPRWRVAGCGRARCFWLPRRAAAAGCAVFGGAEGAPWERGGRPAANRPAPRATPPAGTATPRSQAPSPNAARAPRPPVPGPAAPRPACFIERPPRTTHFGARIERAAAVCPGNAGGAARPAIRYLSPCLPRARRHARGRAARPSIPAGPATLCQLPPSCRLSRSAMSQLKPTAPQTPGLSPSLPLPPAPTPLAHALCAVPRAVGLRRARVRLAATGNLAAA
jgi:hypothetical protein